MNTREQFQYEMRLDKEFDVKQEFNAINFPVSRYEKYIVTLSFEKPLIITEAIKRAEKFLSQPLTEKWWNKVKDNLIIDVPDYDQMCRGSLLGDFIFIEELIVNVTTHNGQNYRCLVIICGS